MEGFSSFLLDAQQQVADFIDFLKVRYQKAKPAKKKVAREALAQEAFIGMWRERMKAIVAMGCASYAVRNGAKDG